MHLLPYCYNLPALSHITRPILHKDCRSDTVHSQELSPQTSLLFHQIFQLPRYNTFLHPHHHRCHKAPVPHSDTPLPLRTNVPAPLSCIPPEVPPVYFCIFVPSPRQG